MCDFCEKAGGMPEYGRFVARMAEEDGTRAEFTKTMAKALPTLAKSAYSSMGLPATGLGKLAYPMFEARAAYAVPSNYFQNILLDGEKLPNSFGHGAMRSVFFMGEKLVVFSKTTAFHDSKEFFTSFLLLSLEKSEYEAKMAGDEIAVKAQAEKEMENLVTGARERKKIAFSFAGQSVQGRIVSKDQAASSSRFRDAYASHGGAQLKSASMDMEGYAITVPHFSPHPYMLQLHEKFGFKDNKEMQLHVADYFRAHVGK